MAVELRATSEYVDEVLAKYSTKNEVNQFRLSLEEKMNNKHFETNNIIVNMRNDVESLR
jgi:hypothetical protein